MAVADNSQSSLNLQFEDVEEALDIHINLAATEPQIFALKERAIDGKYYRMDFQTAGNSYMGARFRGAPQPGYDTSSDAEDQFAEYSVQELKFYNAFVYQSVRFTGQMSTAVKSRKGGYQNLVDFSFDDTVRHMEEQVALRLATSQLGTRAKIQAASGTTITLRYAAHTVAAAVPQPFEVGSRYLRPFQVISATAGSRTAALRAGVNDIGRRITAVQLDTGDNTTGPTITLNSAPTTWAAGDYIVGHRERQNGALTGDYIGRVANPLGLLDAIDDGSFAPYYGGQQRSAAGNESLKCMVNSNAGTTRSLSQQILNRSSELTYQLSGGRPNIFYSTYGVQRKFVDFLTIQGASANASDNQMRYNQPGSKQSIGFNSYDVFPLGMSGQLRMMPSRLAPHHTGFMIEQGSGIFLRDGPPGFIDKDGNKIRKVPGYDEFTSDWKMTAAGFIVKAPWKNCRIDDLDGDHLTD